MIYKYSAFYTYMNKIIFNFDICLCIEIFINIVIIDAK